MDDALCDGYSSILTLLASNSSSMYSDRFLFGFDHEIFQQCLFLQELYMNDICTGVNSSY